MKEQAGGVEETSAVTIALTPRVNRAPRIRPQGNFNKSAVFFDPLLSADTKRSQRNLLSCSTKTPWRDVRQCDQTSCRDKDIFVWTYSVIRFQVVYLFAENLNPKVFAKEFDDF